MFVVLKFSTDYKTTSITMIGLMGILLQVINIWLITSGDYLLLLNYTVVHLGSFLGILFSYFIFEKYEKAIAWLSILIIAIFAYIIV